MNSEQSHFLYRGEFLPYHSTVYEWLSKNRQKRNLIPQYTFDRGLGSEIEEKEIEYTNIAIDGVWDLRIKAKPGNSKSSKTVLVEYKTSIEEMNIDGVVRQIKKRRDLDTSVSKLLRSFLMWLLKNTEYTQYKEAEMILVTFDTRFEDYRSMLEDEDIKLHIFSERNRSHIWRMCHNLTDSLNDPDSQHGDFNEVNPFGPTIRE